MFSSALLRLHVIVFLFFFCPTLRLHPYNRCKSSALLFEATAAAALSVMRLGLAAVVVCLSSLAWRSECAPPTCYSRALGLSKEVMALLEKIHTYHRMKTCAEVLPAIFIDVHNACVTTKLRDFLYVVLNHPSRYCRERPRMVLLKRKIQNLYTIVTRICYRDLVFFTDDCEAIDTGHSRPYYAEDRLQLLQEER